MPSFLTTFNLPFPLWDTNTPSDPPWPPFLYSHFLTVKGRLFWHATLYIQFHPIPPSIPFISAFWQSFISNTNRNPVAGILLIDVCWRGLGSMYKEAPRWSTVARSSYLLSWPLCCKSKNSWSSYFEVKGFTGICFNLLLSILPIVWTITKPNASAVHSQLYHALK